MTQLKPNKKGIYSEARQLLRDGLTRQEAFEILKEKYRYAKDIADILKDLPSKQAIEKYEKWNYALLCLLVLTTAVYLWATPSLGILLLYGLLIYAVAKTLVKYYMWVSVLSTIAVISLTAIVFTSEIAATHWNSLILLFLLLIPSLILPLWLEKKLCPKPTERKEEYTNSQGQQRLKIVYEFPDI